MRFHISARALGWVVVSILSVTATAANPKCPEDGSTSYFTGKMRTSTAGYLMYEYKCASYGHLFWAKAS